MIIFNDFSVLFSDLRFDENEELLERLIEGFDVEKGCVEKLINKKEHWGVVFRCNFKKFCILTGLKGNFLIKTGVNITLPQKKGPGSVKRKLFRRKDECD